MNVTERKGNLITTYLPAALCVVSPSREILKTIKQAITYAYADIDDYQRELCSQTFSKSRAFIDRLPSDVAMLNFSASRRTMFINPPTTTL